MKDADAACHRHRLRLIVRDIQHRCAEIDLDVLQLHAKLRAQLGIERRQGLVHQVNGGTPHERAADRDALHLAARKARRRACELVIDANQLRDTLHPFPDLGFVDAPRRRAQRKREIIVHGKMRIQGILLEHERHVAQCGRVPRRVAAVDGDHAGIGLLQAGDEPQKRGLAGAGRTEQHDEIAARNGETHIFRRFDFPEALGDAVDDDFSHARPPRTGRCSTRDRIRYRRRRDAPWRTAAPRARGCAPGAKTECGPSPGRAANGR